MQIIITVLTIQGQAPFTPMFYTFDQAGGSVGRDNRADWVLLDSKKFLSGTHFKIHCDGKDFSIMDASTNGTFLNDSILPIGLNNAYVLKQGDNIKIGEYILLVSSLESSEMISTALDPIENDISQVENSALIRDPFFSTKGHFSDTGSPKAKVKTKKPQSSFVNNETPNSSLKEQMKDPFFSEDDSFSPEESLLHNELNEENVSHHSYPIDINTPLRINASNQELIENISSPDVSATEPDVFNFLDDKGNETENQAPEHIQPTIVDKTIEKSISPNNTSVVNVSDQQEHVPINRSSNDTKNNEAITQLLRGAGIPEKTISDLPEDTFFIIGSALKDVLQGTIDLLKARSELKNHLHLDRTIIGSVENNPLKFMPNAQQIIIQILTSDKGDKTYLPLGLALEEAFDDIKAHQLAMTVATQKAMRAVIKKHFSPTNLAKNMAKTNPISAVIPVQRQAKLWSGFESLYEDVEKMATESFQRLLDHEVSKAYEEQLLKIKTSRK